MHPPNGTTLQERTAQNGTVPPDVIDCLIVGAGPAGSSLGCFLASHGVKGIIISRESCSTRSPRAHIVNMATCETLQDIGILEKCGKLAIPRPFLNHTRFVNSMLGEEYGRIHSWGHGPAHVGRYEAASPVPPVDIAQNLLDPELMRYASVNGFKVRFDTEFVSYENREDGLIDVLVKDMLSGASYVYRCRYLFGADGGRSKVMTQLEVPFTRKSPTNMAFSVHVKADLGLQMRNRTGCLHWVYQPEIEHPDFAWIGFPRLVNPWNEWLIIFFPAPNYEFSKMPTNDQWVARCKQFIGDPEIEVEILEVTRWYVHHVVASKYSGGNIFGLGDAVHMHPPANGLGLNTSIQDAYNLAWKVAYALQGKAGPRLLESYELERQPVGQQIVERANESYQNHLEIWDALGLLKGTVAERIEHQNEMKSDSPTEKLYREALQTAISKTTYEYSAVGIEMNQRYVSEAVYQGDQSPVPAFTVDPVLEYEQTTYPGARIPHVWLRKPASAEPISTIHLTGDGRFSLLTGIGGEEWRVAAESVSRALHIPISVHAIGFRQEYEDTYFDWSLVRDVEGSGCVLVRPDRVVAWRSKSVLPGGCQARLLEVFRAILCLA